MERSHVEKQLYDATKHLHRPSDSDLEAIVGGECIPCTVSDRIDIVFPTEPDGDAFGR
ncbi:hypothetical protein RDE2_52970 (plasmid) [Rhodococcus sp. RDE2]|nr:hypothetical protein RDE2_52970 [Rhodococcus sp. RDE2]